MTTGLAAHPDSYRPRLWRWRSVFAVLLSLALVFASLHCWCLDLDAGTSAVSVAANDCDDGKTPSDARVAHCDHCMAHVVTVAPPAASAAVEYVAGFYGPAAGAAPATADPASPFEPPRA